MSQVEKTGKLLFKLMAAMGLSVLVACGAVADGEPMDPRVVSYLGDDLISIVKDADRVETFQLRASLYPEGGDGPDFVAGYRWKARGADLAQEEIDVFRAVLFSAASYDFETAKKCPMVPEYVLRFHAGAASADIQLSFSCAMWAVKRGDDWMVEDFDAVTGGVKAIVETVFKLD
ncbi:MAG: hypothetical protein MI741_19145 [Rhodospirillales bacterium]|nr:hypothetical protein [Rhodospirillales bacterium]